MAKLHNRSPGLCGALSTTYNWRTFGLIIGKISKLKQNNKTDIEVWFSFNAKEAFVFAQVSAYFPTSWLPQHVCAAASKNNKKPQSLKNKLAAIQILVF